MKPLRKLTGFIAAAALALTALGQQAAAADLKNDPLIRDALNRANFEPGGKYHLFGSRGTVAERTGLMTISPTVTHQIGNLQIRQATIFSNPGYIVRFSGHGHEVHAPFDNHASRSASAKGGSVLNGFTMFSMSWDGYEHHPADGYDGPQGSGYPAPHGARDIYSYVVKGKAQSIKLNPTDTRSTEQRFADRFGNIPKNLSDRANEAGKKMLEHNPNLDRWGNAMEFINGVAAGAVNPFLSAGEAVGVGDAVQGVGFGIDLATMAAISPMSADTAMSAVGGLSRLGRFEDRASTAVRNWSAENPNAAETVEAALNVAAAAKAAKLAKTGAGKATVGEDFSEAYHARAGLDAPYDSRNIRVELERKYDAENVTSSTVPPANGKNIKLAGQKHPKTNVPFDNKGFPIFDNIAKYDTRINAHQFRSANSKGQMKMATRDLANAIKNGQVNASSFTPAQLKAIQSGKAKIPNYTWHHHQDTGRMQLIDEVVHRRTGHIGGESMDKGR